MQKIATTRTITTIPPSRIFLITDVSPYVRGISSGAHVIRQSRRPSTYIPSLRVLIQTQNLSGGIAESSGDFQRVRAERAHDRSAICGYLVDGHAQTADQ